MDYDADVTWDIDPEGAEPCRSWEGNQALQGQETEKFLQGCKKMFCDGGEGAPDFCNGNMGHVGGGGGGGGSGFSYIYVLECHFFSAASKQTMNGGTILHGAPNTAVSIDKGGGQLRQSRKIAWWQSNRH